MLKLVTDVSRSEFSTILTDQDMLCVPLTILFAQTSKTRNRCQLWVRSILHGKRPSMGYRVGEDEHHAHKDYPEGDEAKNDRGNGRKISGEKENGRRDREQRAYT
jgi:hypothetical protein